MPLPALAVFAALSVVVAAVLLPPAMLLGALVIVATGAGIAAAELRRNAGPRFRAPAHIGR